jgi:O-antigen/teichoic acid export membrane protein
MKNFQKGQIKSSGWILAEYIIRSISGVFVGAYIARMLGPGRFGEFTFIISIAGVVGTVARLGLDSVLIKDFSEGISMGAIDARTPFSMLFVAGIFSVAAMGAIGLLQAGGDSVIYYLIIACSLPLQSLMIVDLLYQSRVQGGVTVKARLLCLGIFSALRFVAAARNWPYVWFYILYLAEQAMLSLLYAAVAYTDRSYLDTIWNKFDAAYMKRLLSDGWPLVISSVASILYLKVDQLVLMSVKGNESLGVYSSASKFFEIGVSLLYVVSTSLLPLLIRKRAEGTCAYFRLVSSLFRYGFYGGLLVAGIISVFAEQLVVLLYGSAYREGGVVLVIMLLALPFSGLTSLSARFLVSEGLQRAILTRTLLGLLLSLVLSVVLIPMFGSVGAALSLALTNFASGYLLDYFDKRLAPLLKCKNSALFFVKNDFCN